MKTSCELFVVFVVVLPLLNSNEVNAVTDRRLNHNRIDVRKSTIVVFPDETATDNSGGGKSGLDGDRYEDETFIDPFPEGIDYNRFVNRTALKRCIRSGQTYCVNEATIEFNHDQIERSFEKALKMKNVFISNATTHQDTSLRFGGFDTVMPFCETKSSVIFPKWGRDVDGDWRLILNQQEYRQAIRVHFCVPTPGNSKINKMTNLGREIQLPNGYRKRCKQVHQEYEMFSVNRGEIEKRVFLMPSHCEFEALR